MDIDGRDIVLIVAIVAFAYVIIRIVEDAIEVLRESRKTNKQPQAEGVKVSSGRTIYAESYADNDTILDVSGNGRIVSISAVGDSFSLVLDIDGSISEINPELVIGISEQYPDIDVFKQNDQYVVVVKDVYFSRYARVQIRGKAKYREVVELGALA